MSNVRKPIQKTMTANADNIVQALVNAPGNLRSAEINRDTLRAQFDKLAAELSIQAMNEPLFSDKPDGEKRPASNEAQRKQAVEHTLTHDKDAVELRGKLDAAQRDVTYYRNQQENVQLIARLLIEQAKSS